MAGYSATPLPRKLGIKERHRIALVGPPHGFQGYLGKLPDRVDVRAGGPLDVILFFTTRRAELERRFVRLAGALDAAGGLWIAWPKRSSGVETDLTEDIVR